MQAEHEFVNSTVLDWKSKHERLSATHSELQATHSELQAAHSELQATHADLDATALAVASEIERQHQQLEAEREIHAAVSSELALLRNTYAHLKGQLSDLQAEAAALQSEVEGLHRGLSDAYDREEKARKRVVELEAELGSSLALEKELRASVQTSLEQLDEAEVRAASCQASLMDQLEALRVEVERRESVLQDLKSEVQWTKEASQQLVGERDKTVSGLMGEMEAKDAQLLVLQLQVRQLSELAEQSQVALHASAQQHALEQERNQSYMHGEMQSVLHERIVDSLTPYVTLCLHPLSDQHDGLQCAQH
jgi:chromosome segregation ATPase